MKWEDDDAEVHRGTEAQLECTSPEKKLRIRLTSEDMNSITKQTWTVEKKVQNSYSSLDQGQQSTSCYLPILCKLIQIV